MLDAHAILINRASDVFIRVIIIWRKEHIIADYYPVT